MFNEKAGSAHGDLSTSCKNHAINTEVREVHFYGSTTGTPYLEGMSIVTQPFRDAKYPGQTISAGRVGQKGQTKRSLVLPKFPNGNEALFSFFGFVT